MLAQAAKAQGLYNGKYVFISMDLYTWESSTSVPKWLLNYPEDLFEGWFDVSSKTMLSSQLTNAKQRQFLGDLQMRLLQGPFYVQVKQVCY